MQKICLRWGTVGDYGTKSWPAVGQWVITFWSARPRAVSRSAHSAPWCRPDVTFSYQKEFHAGFTVPESTLRQSDDFGLKHVTVTATQGLKVAAGHESQSDNLKLVKSSIYLFQEHVKSQNETKNPCKNWKLMFFFFVLCLLSSHHDEAFSGTYRIVKLYSYQKKKEVVSSAAKVEASMCFYDNRANIFTEVTHVLYYVTDKCAECICHFVSALYNIWSALKN